MTGNINVRTGARMALIVAMAALTVTAMFSGGVAAGTIDGTSASGPGNIAAEDPSASQDLVSNGNLELSAGGATETVSVIIEIEDLQDAGADISQATVSAEADTGSVDSAIVSGDEIQIVATAAGSNIVIDTLDLNNIDTTGVEAQSGLSYRVRVSEDGNAGDFDDATFSTEDSDNTASFNIAFIEVEDVDDGTTTTVTSISEAVAAVNDADQNEEVIRVGAGTYTFDNVDIQDDNVRIETVDGADVTFEHANGGDRAALSVSASNVEIDGVTFDLGQIDNVADEAIAVSSGADLSVTNSTFTNAGNAVSYLSAPDDAGSVSVTGSTFEDGTNSADGIEITDSGTGADLTVQDNTFDGLADGVDVSNTPSDLNSIDISNNDFTANNIHVAGDPTDGDGAPDLDAVFNSNSNTFDKYAIVENANGNIAAQGAYEIAGDFGQVGTTIDAADRTVVLSAGDHANPGSTSITSDGVTFTSADDASAEDVVVTADTANLVDVGGDISDLTISDLTFDVTNNVLSANTDNTATVTNLAVENNRFINVPNGITVINLGANTETLVGASINGNTIEAADDGGNTYTAIVINEIAESSGEDSQISNNVVSGAQTGITVTNLADNGNPLALTVENNDIEITSGSQTGLDLQGLNTGDEVDVSVSNNVVSADGAADATGVLLNAGDTAVVSVTENEISGFNAIDDHGVGLDISGFDNAATASELTVESNTFDTNALHIVFSGEQDGSTLVDDNSFATLVEVRGEEGGDLAANQIHGTIQGGATDASRGDFVGVSDGTYEESSLLIDDSNDRTGINAVTIAATGDAVMTTDTQNPFFTVTTPGEAVEIRGLTFNSTDDGAAIPDISVTDTNNDLTVSENVFQGAGTDNRQGVVIADVSSDATITVSDNTFSNYAEAFQIDDTDDDAATTIIEVVRNDFSNAATAVNLLNIDSTADPANEIRVHFNDIVDNEVGVTNDITAGDNGAGGDNLLSVRANWWGDESGPSGDDFNGDSDASDSISGAADGDLTAAPWLDEPAETLATDQYVVVNDPRDRVAGNDDAEVLVAVLNDTTAEDADETDTVLTASPSGPLSGLGAPDAGTGADAADPLRYDNPGISSTETGDYTLTAQHTDALVSSGSTVQTFVSEPAGVEVTADTESLVADDTQTVNVTLQVIDENGNALSANNDPVSFAIENGSDAGINAAIREGVTDTNGQAQLRFTADTAGVEVGVTGIYNDQGFSDSVTVSTVEPAATNFTLDLVEGPTTITQNESYSATLEVTNEGDAAGTQTIEYTLEDSNGLSSGIEASEEVSLDAGNSTEITFEVPASATADLETGNYTHVFASDDDELTVDAEVVENVTVPTDPEERALQLTGVNNASELTQDDVTAAITRFERNESANGVDPTQDDVTTVITLFERN